MDKTNWQVIKAHFEELLTLSSQEQQDWLARQAKSDPKTAAKLEQMLAADGDDSSKITRAVSTNIDQLYQQNFNHQEGEVIGGYKIEKLIGKGGMGVVFAASRSDKAFEQKVAIKLIQSHSINPDSIRRFESERQILANLNHPNIAHLIDGGTTQKGIPFLVMEFIEGVPILDYCIGKQLNLSERIELFLQVCSAVSYAHQNLIIHRDIKPSNVLVNNEGQIKLLDFGIAKILDPEAYQQDVVNTQAEMRLLSLENASPEQITGDAITTQTDVYSLGNLLYQLLTEETLFQVAKKTRLNLERAICETQPIKPSVAVTENKSAISAKSAERLKNFKRSIKGDLDTITLKALSKAPQDRYASVEQFSDDIHRYLNHYPIIARPVKFSYQAAKFVGRNKLLVTLSSLLVLSVTFFTISLGIKSTQLEIETQKAIAESKIAKETSEFLSEIFEFSNPNNQDGSEPTASELLASGVEKINKLDSTPQVKATLLNTLGVVYSKLGKFEKAEQLLSEALNIRKSLSDVPIEELIETQVNLSEAYAELGKYQLAEKGLRESITLANENPQIPAIKTIPAKTNLATILSWNGELEEALALNQSVAILAVSHFGENSKEAGSAQSNLGYILSLMGDFDSSIEALKKGLKARRAAYGNNHLETAHSLNHLSFTMANTGQFREALPLAREGLEVRKSIYRAAHPELVTSHNNVATILSNLNQHEEAEKIARESLKIAKEIYPSASFDLGATYYSLGSTLLRKKDFERAIDATNQCLLVLQQILPKQSPQLAFPLTQLGRIHIQNKNYVNAEEVLQKAYDYRKKGLPKGNWQIAESAHLLAIAMTNQDKHAAAKPLAEEAYQSMLSAFGQDDNRVKQLEELMATIGNNL